MNTATATLAYEWHRRPADFDGPCPICGCPNMKSGEHRAVRPEEGLRAEWVRRHKTNQLGYRKRILGPKPPPAKPGPAPKVSRVGLPTAQTRDAIARATQLLAEGTPLAGIAKALGVTPRAVEYWRTNHPEIWQRDFQQAIKGIVDQVRATAGTDKVLADPDEYLRLATIADKWTAERGEQLFPIDSEDLSLSRFYRSYFEAVRLGDAQPETKRQYEITLNLWRRITGDPPLRLLRNEILAKFRDVLLKTKGHGGRPYSPNTVRSKMTMIQAILDAAGPQGPRRREAAGILAKVPYAKPPREELDVPRIVSAERLAAVYNAAKLMDRPNVDGVAPVDWWQTLIAVALNTALRHKTLFSLRWEWVDWTDCVLTIPRENMKARRGHAIPLNEEAVKHLQRLRNVNEGELIFPWPYSREHFGQSFKLLQGLAGIAPGERFGLHAIRRTAGTLLWKNCPEAAQILLGHTTAKITLRHYVNPREAMGKSLDKIPQPWAPKPTGGDGKVA